MIECSSFFFCYLSARYQEALDLEATLLALIEDKEFEEAYTRFAPPVAFFQKSQEQASKSKFTVQP